MLIDLELSFSLSNYVNRQISVQTVHWTEPYFCGSMFIRTMLFSKERQKIRLKDFTFDLKIEYIHYSDSLYLG